MIDIKDLTSFVWATVTAVGPLRIRLDGDTSALLLTPECLLDSNSLVVGSRVRVELSQRKVVIHGTTEDGDNNWSALGSLLIAGMSGTLSAKRSGQVVTIVGSLSGDVVGGTTLDILDTPMAARFRPSTLNRQGGYYANGQHGVAFCRPAGTIALRHNASGTISTAHQFTLTYVV